MNASIDLNQLEIDCAAVKAKISAGEKFLLLDCRERDEYLIVSIAGAKLIPMSEIQQRLTELNSHRDSEIIVHCHHGSRSLDVAIWLRQLGFDKVKSMSGGIDQWAVQIDNRLPRY